MQTSALWRSSFFAEGAWSSGEEKLTFSRGVSTYPLPRQGVYLLTREEAGILYRSAEGQRSDGFDPLFKFATYIGADSAPCRANIDKMFGLHCAVLGSTGSGKSGAVAALIHGALQHRPKPESKAIPESSSSIRMVSTDRRLQVEVSSIARMTLSAQTKRRASQSSFLTG